MSQRRVAVIMDPIESIKPYKDTTLAMMLEIQRRGWEVIYLQLDGLYLRMDQAFGRGHKISLKDDNHDWFARGDAVDEPLTAFDLILMRKDPPVTAEYVYATQILELAEQQGALVSNKPQSLRDCNEKLYSLAFPECCAPTMVSGDAAHIRAFIEEQGKAVLKPLFGMGGASIFVVEHGDPNTSVIIETLSEGGARFLMAQRYLPEIKHGDKRILMIDGEPVPYALARIPAKGETRGNLAAGGHGEGVALSERDRWICAQVGPALKARNLHFVGLDVIGDYLTEINVTSPTCVRELDRIYDLNISAQLFDALETRFR